MAPHVSSLPADSETTTSSPQGPASGRDGRPDRGASGGSRGPVIAIAVALLMSVGAIGWLLIAGSADDDGADDSVAVVAEDPVVADSSVTDGDGASSTAADEADGTVGGSGDVAPSGPGDGSDAGAPVIAEPVTQPDTSDGSVDAAADVGSGSGADALADAGSESDADASVGTSSEAQTIEPEIVLQPQSRAVFRDGQVILFGAVPSREIADEIFDLAASVLGPENVIDDYEIDPTVPPPTTGNLTVEETIEFGSGTAVLPDPVPDILPVGVALMAVRPTAELRLIGHTDGRGSQAANVELSLARAEAVKAYFVENGIDADRIETVGMGESQPVASDDTEEGRRENRRIEFEVSNILGDGG